MKKEISWLYLSKMLIITFMSMLFLPGCQKEELPSKIQVNGSTNAILPYSFNWEDPNLNWMPYPTNIITPPWVGQGSLYSTVDPDVLTDRKALNGWTLVYSTFTPSTAAINPYFILYNKYRGLMRIFIYVNNSSFASSSYLQDGITLANNQYSILNFAGFDVIDASQKQTRFDKVEPAPKDGTAPFATFKWYMLQYEFAYDPTLVPTTSAYPPQFSFYINSINIDFVKLGGTQKGTLKGTIGSSASSGSNFFSTITPGLKLLGTGVLAGLGSQFFTNHVTSDTSNSLGLPNGIFKSISSGLSSALSTATGGLPGAVTNILSAIIGGNSGSAVQTVSLNLSTQISLDGTISNTTSFPSSPTSLYLPGSIMADANGNYNVQSYIPLYNAPLGVFNLSNKPRVQKTIIITSRAPYEKYVDEYGTTYDYHTIYVIDKSSFTVQWNPSVLSIANISNITYEVILLNNQDLDSTTGRTESLLGYSNSKVKKDQLDTYFLDHINKNWRAPGTVLMRMSFNVVPKDGSQISTIVKTFAVNVTQVVY